MKTAISTFRKLSFSTLIAVLFLILVGGVVRTTGSGMGCPDWPKCFGQWIPPTTVAQLPADYKEQYAQYREAKNVKFAGYLKKVGLVETANKLTDDPAVLIEADFNALKTWIEYVNRLVGAVIGLFILGVFAYSLKFLKSRPLLPILATSILVMVLFQGWFGSIVVSTNLTTWTITIHMLLALLIVAMLVVLWEVAGAQFSLDMSTESWLMLIGMVILFSQIVMGTKVRESVDVIAQTGSDRSTWIGSLGSIFVFHRSFSWIVLIIHVIIYLRLNKIDELRPLSLYLFSAVLAVMLSGIAMAYASIPAFVQPLHLLIATAAFALQVMLFMRLLKKPNFAMV